MSIVIFQNRPNIPSLPEREWYHPIRSETLSGLADSVNNLAAVKCVGHICHRFHWKRGNDGIVVTDPQLASSTLHRILIPIRSVFSTHFTWALRVQAHAFNSGALRSTVEMCVEQGVQLSAPVNGDDMLDGKDDDEWGVLIEISNGGIPNGGRADLDVDSGTFQYPVMETRGLIVRDELTTALMPTSLRAMHYGSAGGDNSTLTLLVRSNLARPIQLTLNEVSPILFG